MEHTNEFLQGMFAAYYGSPVLETHNDGDTITDVIDWEFLSRYKYNDVDGKPILTPISKISDEDLIKILGWEHHKDIEIREKQVSIEGVFCSAFCTNSKGEAKAKGLTASLIFDCLPLRHTDYLRSKHYDCGYLHISSLIKAGLAVKATK